MGLLSACFGKGTNSTQIMPTSGASGSGVTKGTPADIVGMLTQAQQMELQSAFRRFDVNGNGTIDATELKTVMQQLGATIDDTGIEEILTAVDVDQNNQIEWTEFSALMADRWLRQDGDVDMELAVSLFKISDEDDLLDVNRMREYLTTIGEAPLDASEVDQIVAMADPKGTGRMTTETFRTLPCWQPPPMTESSMKAASILGGSSRPGTALAEGSSRNQDATGSSEGGGVTAG